jgi:hypothetical protein
MNGETIQQRRRRSFVLALTLIEGDDADPGVLPGRKPLAGQRDPAPIQRAGKDDPRYASAGSLRQL